MKYSKNKRKKTLLVPLFLFFLIVLFFFFNEEKNVVGSNIKLESKLLDSFELTKILSASNKEVFYFNDKKGEIIHIEKISGLDKQNSEKLIKNKKFNLDAIFSNEFSAYPGEISNKIQCETNLIPTFQEIKINNEVRDYYLLYTNNRFNLGVCTKDNIYYRYLIGWIYCTNFHELYTVNYFSNINASEKKMEEFISSFNCKNN